MNTARFRSLLLVPVFCLVLASSLCGQEKISALLVDGQNNHRNWPQTSEMMKAYLEQTELFEVDIARTAEKGVDEKFAPNFGDYDVVISNYNGAAWPDSTKKSFVDYIDNGGGLVVVHAANNAFGDWTEYNEMIGLGGWGGRNESSGPYVYYSNDGEKIIDKSEGRGGSHGPQHPFQIIIRDDEHPITKDLPQSWMHVNDELYDSLRGPAKNMKILATAFSSKDKRGTNRHEPMLMTLTYGEGRIFHTPMGHGNDSQQCVGFITVFQRGCQWAASGEVTIDVPDDFPTSDETSSREFEFEDKK